MDQIEIDIEELAKAKKRVWVKATATRKGHYREQKVGREKEDIHGEPEAMTGSQKTREVVEYFDSLSQEDERVAMAFDDAQGGLTDAYVAGRITWDDAIRPIATKIIKENVRKKKAAKKREKILQGYK